ncbi:ABC-three component system middle component 8 [Draconibacterium sp. IB214405]|uniref:ABC-three component system middle component 8 n=1 Tax=Draconibacterium sp. IB214405 TaxID=3097352 RepID=UPI002A0DE802|nr:ABC-three component system middle component 8 [Draconibacterium sp. IB214405]MDX8341662.1 ABC-three component system middle component 8 [Draconibacterium sp. IB214405]
MIKPDRHTNPDNSVINISAYILKQLNSFYDISYDKLLKKVTDDLGVNAKENYPYALNFLYLLGKLEYIEETDSFKYNAAK